MVDKIKKLFSFSFVRFLIIGSASFGLDFGIYNILLLLNVYPIFANMTSLLISLFFNFYLSNYWTFKAGKEQQTKKAFRYGVLATFNYIFNNFLLYLGITYLHIHPVIAKILVTLLQMNWTFWIYKFWVFKTPDLKN